MQKTNSKVADISPAIFTSTLNVNELNAPLKRQK